MREREAYARMFHGLGCLTQCWNLLGLIRQSDVLDAFNLLTVLYELDTATEIVHVWPAVIGRVYHRTYVSRLFTLFFSSDLLGWLPSISKFLYSACA